MTPYSLLALQMYHVHAAAMHVHTDTSVQFHAYQVNSFEVIVTLNSTQF